MANYNTLKTAIQNAIYENHNNEIDALDLRQTLITIVNSLGVGYQLIGVALENTNPGTPDQNVFYIAGPGTYPNFGATPPTVQEGYLGVFRWNGNWTFNYVPVGKDFTDEINQLGQELGKLPLDVTATLNIEQGDIKTNNGQDNPSDYRIRTNGYIKTKKIIVSIATGGAYVYGYSDSTYLGSDGWKTGGNNEVEITGATRYRLAFKNANGSATIEPSDFASLGVSVYADPHSSFVGVDEQSFSDEEKEQARANIGAASLAALTSAISTEQTRAEAVEATKANDNVVVKHTASQGLTDTQKANARTNIGAGNVADVNANTFKVDEITDKVGIRILDKYWATASSSFKDGGCFMIPVKNASVISFIGNGSNNGNYGFLTGYNVENNTITLVPGESIGTISSRANTSKDVPEGTLFIYLLAAVGSTNRLPSVFKVDGVDVIPSLIQSVASVKAGLEASITTLTNRISGDEGDITALQNIAAYSKIRGAYLVSAVLSDWTKNSIYIRKLNIYYNTSGPKTIELNTTYTFTSDGFLLLNFTDIQNPVVSQVSTMSNKPYDAILLRYIDGKGFVDGLLFAQYVAMFRSPIEYIREVPKNNAALNVYKKAKQFQLVKWTPKADVPDNSHAVGFPVGVEVTGLPYSSVKEKSKFVGFDVSLLTFMTAVNNPYSLLYTEDTAGSRSRSGYGFSYYGISSSAYFGIVCNVFALHSLGFDVPWNTGEFHYLADKGILEAAYDQSANGLELMDLLWQIGHGSLIDDIYKDMRGNIKQVYWNDSVSPVPRSFVLTADQFSSKMIEDGVTIYHYKELYKNIHYEPSPFVAVEDEPTPEPFDYNDDICTYAGDYACFKPGEKVVLNYNLADDANFGYTGIKLYKLIDNAYVLQGSVIPIDSSHKLDISSYLSGYGKYKATATDGTNESEATFFEVIDNQASYTNVGNGVKRISFSSQNGNALYLEFVYGGRGGEYNGSHQATDDVAGQCCGTYQFTTEELTQGYAEINPVELRDSQYQATDSTDSVGYRPFNSLAKGDVYVRVHFVGDYGRVISDYILTDLWNAS